MAMPDLNSGALAPVRDEVDVLAPQVIGAIPSGLDGMLVRNGPNPLSGRFAGAGVLNWWPEAAMLHGIRFAGGRALTYRNRWVRTRNWAAATAAAQPDRYVASNPNVNVIHHAGVTLALAEGGVPLAIDAELGTLGLPATHPGVAAGMTAHPKIDPESQELFGFRQDWAPPYVRYLVFDAEGATVLNSEIDTPAPAMMHDMAITESSSLLLDLSVSLDLSLLERGVRMPIRWYDERPSRLGMLPRRGGPVSWIPIDPCFIQHVVNAYDDDDGTLVLDVARYPWYFRFDARAGRFEEEPLANLWRYRIDPVTGTAGARQLDDACIELPRVSDRVVGRKYRYLYAVEQPSNAQMHGILKYDLQTGAVQRHRLAPGDQNSEPVFVPRADGRAEDDGWLLVCVYRQATDSTDVLILDAQDVRQPPLATVRLPRRIPAGFHGAWVPA